MTTVRSITQEIQQIIQTLWQMMGSKNGWARAFRAAVCAVAIMALAGAGVFAYRWYAAYRDGQAHSAFAASFEQYHAASQSENPDWTTIAGLFAIGYSTHARSNLAPFFLLMQAQAVQKQGQEAQARTLVQRALDQLPTSSPLYYLYALKHALMQLDATDEDTQRAGFTQLQTLAHQDGNLHADAARYHLGAYYWAQDDLNNAQKEWQELIKIYGKAQAMPSPWARQAEKQLGLYRP